MTPVGGKVVRIFNVDNESDRDSPVRPMHSYLIGVPAETQIISPRAP
jgi:hypothetical protein